MGLIEAVQERIVFAEVQAHVVRAAANALCRTPEVRAVALVVEIPIAIPVASRERREPESIITIAIFSFIFIPSVGGLQQRRCVPEQLL